MITSIEYYYVHSFECFHTFHRIFYMLQIIFEYSLDCLRTFPEMFNDIPRNVLGHSPECLATFPGVFEDIPRNAWRHSPECLRTFPGMFGDNPRNVWGHSPEYYIAPIPRITSPVPVFLVLDITIFLGRLLQRIYMCLFS